MTAPDWAALVPMLAGLMAWTALAVEPDDGAEPVLHDELALLAAMPWV